MWRRAIAGFVVMATTFDGSESPEPAKPQPAPINWTMPTSGGKQFWTDVRHFHGWRIQRNYFTGHHRLLDDRNYRRAWGTHRQCQSALDRFRRELKMPPMQGKAVVLLHGLLRSRNSMTPLADYLRDQGYQVFNVSYASSRQTIGEHAASLREVVESLKGIDKISFVAHSLGNLVVRHFLTDATKSEAGVDPRIHRVAMIAPPNQGSQLAATFTDWTLFKVVWGVSGGQIAQREKLAGRLAAPPCQFGVIAGVFESKLRSNPLLTGRNDFVVTIDETRLRGARDFLILPASHMFILDNKLTHEHVLRFLEHGYFISDQRRQPIDLNTVDPTSVSKE